MGQKRTILLVEDNPADVYLARMALEGVDPPCELQVSEDGVEAMNRLIEAADRGTLPDLVILDLALPRLGGKEILQRIRGLDSLAGLPVAILTGTQNPHDESDLRAVGADAFLCKPMDGPPMFDQILDLLGRIGPGG